MEGFGGRKEKEKARGVVQAVMLRFLAQPTGATVPRSSPASADCVVLASPLPAVCTTRGCTCVCGVLEGGVGPRRGTMK